MTKAVFVFSENFFPLLAKIKNIFLLPIIRYVFTVIFLFTVIFWKYIFKSSYFLKIAFIIKKYSEYLVLIIQNFLWILFQKQGIRHTLAQLAVNVAPPYHCDTLFSTSSMPYSMSMRYFLNSLLCTCMCWSHLVCWDANLLHSHLISRPHLR
jgi:hypothetical protein